MRAQDSRWGTAIAFSGGVWTACFLISTLCDAQVMERIVTRDEVDRDSQQMFYLRGYFVTEAHWDEAMESIQRGDLDQAVMCYVAGYNARLIGDVRRAIGEYSEAIQYNPDYVAALVGRALAWYQDGQCEEAIRDLSRAVELDPQFPDAHSAYGFVYLRMGECRKAINSFLNP